MVRKGVRPYKNWIHYCICVYHMVQSLFVIGHGHGSDEREHVPGETEGDREHERGPWQREVKDRGEATAGGHRSPEDPQGTVNSLTYSGT